MTKQEKRIFKAHLKKDAGDIFLRIIMAIVSIILGIDYILLSSIVLGSCWVLIGILHIATVGIYISNAYNATKDIMIDVETLEKNEHSSNISRY